MPTSIEEIKKTGKFSWGKPIAWYEIGPYALLEYHPYKYEDSRRTRWFSDKTEFYGWIDGKACHESWPSLETGIVGLIIRKWAGLNNRNIGRAFCRGIQAPPYEKEEK